MNERLHALIKDELTTFNVKQGDSSKSLEGLNKEFIKRNFNSLVHRAEGKNILINIDIAFTRD